MLSFLWALLLTFFLSFALDEEEGLKKVETTADEYVELTVAVDESLMDIYVARLKSIPKTISATLSLMPKNHSI